MNIFERLKVRAGALGFLVDEAPGGGNFLVLRPVDDALPLYNRDATCYTGDAQSLTVFLHGILWARDYDKMIKLSTDDKRQEKEQKIKNRQLLAKLTDEA